MGFREGALVRGEDRTRGVSFAFCMVSRMAGSRESNVLCDMMRVALFGDVDVCFEDREEQALLNVAIGKFVCQL